MASSFVLAGVDGLISAVKTFKKSNENNNQITPKTMENFFSKTCNKFLRSYGMSFKGKKSYKNYNRKEAEMIARYKKFGFFDKSEFYIDSGAFQISMGILNKRESDILYDIYYDFTVDYKDSYDRAFILDLPPGPGCQMFKTFKEVRDLTEVSYRRACALPDDVREKIVYIHHCRTPEMWKIGSELLEMDDMFDKFKYHATGGLVASMGGDVDIPCIIYAIPLVPLLKKAVQYKRTFLNYHILGSSSYRDVFFYELMKKHVKEQFNIDLEITYDSSVLFKGFIIGRRMFVYEDDIVKRMDLRTKYLDHRFNNEGETTLQCFLKHLDLFAEEYGLTPLGYNHIYDTKTETFFYGVRLYTFLYMLAMYDIMEKKTKEVIDRIYPLYKEGDYDLFNNELEKITRNLNGNRITKKQMIKTYNTVKSLDMIKNLDDEQCKHIVDTFLVRDEFKELKELKLINF